MKAFIVFDHDESTVNTALARFGVAYEVEDLDFAEELEICEACEDVPNRWNRIGANLCGYALFGIVAVIVLHWLQ